MPDSILALVRPCVKCGACVRNAKGKCKPCTAATSAAWKAANIEKIKAYATAYNPAYYDAHKDKIKATTSAYYAANPEKAKAARVAWAKDNPEKLKTYNATYRAANPKKKSLYTGAWRTANPDKVKAYSAAWAKANPEAIRNLRHKRRARKQNSGGSLSRGLVSKLLILQKGKCPCCGLLLGENYHMDHIIPLALGGSNTDDNIQLLRQRCNIQKRAKHPVDFMQERGFLL